MNLSCIRSDGQSPLTPGHLLFSEFKLLPSGCRYDLPRGRANTFKTLRTLVLFGCSVMLCIAFLFVSLCLFCFPCKIVCVLISEMISLLLAVQQSAALEDSKYLDISYFVCKPVSLDFGFYFLRVFCNAGSCRLQQTATPLISPSPIVAA